MTIELALSNREIRHYTEFGCSDAQDVSLTLTKPAAFTLRPSPRLVFGPVPRSFPTWYYNDRGADETGVLLIRRAILRGIRVVACPLGVLIVPQCGLHHDDIQTDLNNLGPLALTTDEELLGEWVILPGAAYNIYGHWLIDFIPRLFNLVRVSLDPTICRYLVPSNLPAFALEWLNILGIPDYNIRHYDPSAHAIQLERAFLPMGLRGASRVNPMMSQVAKWVLSRVLSGEADTDVRGRRIFVSRSSWSNATRVLTNEEELSAIAQGLGFEIVYPERLSILEQVRLFASADIIVGDYGSALHNAIFSRSGTMVIAFRGTEGHPGFLQSGLCEVLGQDLAYIFGETVITGNGHAYCVDPVDFRLCLDLVMMLPRALETVDTLGITE